MKHLLETVSAALLTAILVVGVTRYGPGTPEEVEFTTSGLGEVLFTEYVVQFELVGVLLTVAMVGAVFIALKGEEW